MSTLSFSRSPYPSEMSNFSAVTRTAAEPSLERSPSALMSAIPRKAVDVTQVHQLHLTRPKFPFPSSFKQCRLLTCQSLRNFSEGHPRCPLTLPTALAPHHRSDHALLHAAYAVRQRPPCSDKFLSSIPSPVNTRHLPSIVFSASTPRQTSSTRKPLSVLTR